MSQPYLANHVHHMIPRFLGGTDDPSNLVTLTVKEHRKAHWVAFHLWEDPRDLLAARVLEGMADDAVSCIWCKKSYSMWNYEQHIHGGKCKHPAQPKGRYTHTRSCIRCRKGFTKANLIQHIRSPKQCWGGVA